MTPPHTAAAAGQFRIAGDISINRLSFGAMRIAGVGIWGESDEVMQMLRRLPELGVTFIDTAAAMVPSSAKA